jgi:hypothetical protein
MTSTKQTRATRVIASAAIAAFLVLDVSAGPASARWDHRDDHRDSHHGWTGGYWHAPPVVYGGPTYYGYYPPPVAYEPGIGVNLPGVHIGIH